MNVSPVRSGHRGRPRNRVCIGKIFPVVPGVLRFRPFDSGLFPDDCLIFGSSARVCERLRQYASSVSPGDVFSVTFTGSSQRFPEGVAFSVSSVVFLGTLEILNNESVQ